MENELLPCPFCGSPAELKVDADHHGEFYSLGCSIKECLAHNIYYTEMPEDLPIEQAVKNWNQRAGL